MNERWLNGAPENQDKINQMSFNFNFQQNQAMLRDRLEDDLS